MRLAVRVRFSIRTCFAQKKQPGRELPLSVKMRTGLLTLGALAVRGER